MKALRSSQWVGCSTAFDLTFASDVPEPIVYRYFVSGRGGSRGILSESLPDSGARMTKLAALDRG